MSFDLSRIRFDARRDFLGVIMQQGRVQLDADWNEWVAQLARRIQAGTMDTIGLAVVPRETTPDGFRIEASGGALTIAPGRMYVDGLLAENHGADPAEWNRHLAEEVGTAPVDYGDQPYLPDAPSLPDGAGPHLVYLDVWQRDVTHLEEPDLVEKAVGVDSTGRLQTVWQVKVLEDVGDVDCATPDEDIPGWEDLTRPSAGRLSTDTGDPPGDPDPCQVPASAGYRGLENQLYRVEIHTGGDAGDATFKWSRDNATVATRVTHINPAGDRLTVESVGRDDVLRFHDGDWVEITDDWLELHNRPGLLRRIRLGGGVDDATRTVELEAPLPAGEFPVDGLGATDPARHTRVRRWDQSGQVRREDGSSFVDLDDAAATGEIPVPPAGTRLFLEHGILVQFDLDPAGGEFRSGDVWVFAARSVDASIEILEQAPARAMHHHYARLAVVTFPDDEIDCRTLWPPVNEGESCDCTVCVHAEAHNEGIATIQQAIDTVTAGGGTICLGPGTYRIREPLRMRGAQSIRMRGQGWRTVLVGETPGTILDVAGGMGVTVEHLSMVGSATGGGTTAVVTVDNVVGLRLDHVNLLGIATGDATSAAVEMSGYVLGGAIVDCAIVAEQGVVRAAGQREYLLTGHFRAEDNVLLCSQRGFSLDGISLHYGACGLVDNLIVGCTQSSIDATGGVLAGSSLTVSGNVIYASGTGIRAGVDGLRIQNNEITGSGSRSDDGIALAQGLDPVAIDHVQIIGNRIQSMGGNGVAIRHHVEHGMIKQNAIDGVGLGGVIMEEGGSASYLTIENNHFLDLGRGFDNRSVEFAGMQLIATQRADVTDNLFDGIARDALGTPAVAGILGGGIGELRVAGNRMHGIGPDRSAGATACLRFLTPFRHLAIDDNTAGRAAAEGATQPAPAAWLAVRVDDGLARDEFNVGSAAGNFAYVAVDDRAFLLTAVRARAFQSVSVGTSVRGNRFRAQMTTAPLVLIDRVESCLFTENHCQIGSAAGAGGTLLGFMRANVVNASNNRLQGDLERETLRVFNLSKRGVVVGNISTGGILVDGSPPPAPWDKLNVIGT